MREAEKGRWARRTRDAGVEEDRGCVILKVNKKDDGAPSAGTSPPQSNFTILGSKVTTRRQSTNHTLDAQNDTTALSSRSSVPSGPVPNLKLD